MPTATKTSPELNEVLHERRIRRLTIAAGPHRLSGRAWNLEGSEIVLGRSTGDNQIAIADEEMSARHAALVAVPGFGVYAVRDLGSKNGLLLNGRRVAEGILEPGCVLRLGSTLLVYNELVVHDGFPREVWADEAVPVHASRASFLARLAAHSTVPTLIHGPTGSGKELLAREIHSRSGRTGPMVVLNCAAISRELIASELFGHVRGAFSGAEDHRLGAVRSAEGGTLFLDEIGDLPLEHQSSLLRVLQEKSVKPVGMDAEIPVDFHLVAATHRNLEEMASTGQFRHDLLARVDGFTIELPPLRERREEILPCFLQYLGHEQTVVPIDVAESLLLYEWPGNFRELHQVARVLSVFVPATGKVFAEMLPERIRVARRALEHGAPPEEGTVVTRQGLELALKQVGGNVAEVARALGISRQRVYRLLEEHDLAASAYRVAGGTKASR